LPDAGDQRAVIVDAFSQKQVQARLLLSFFEKSRHYRQKRRLRFGLYIP